MEHIDLDDLIDLAVNTHIKASRPRLLVRHVKRGSIYRIMSYGDEYHLREFYHEGSVHVFEFDGIVVQAEFQFSGDGTRSRYAGPIVIYRCIDTGKFWMRPTFEFYDGRFELVKEQN